MHVHIHRAAAGLRSGIRCGSGSLCREGRQSICLVVVNLRKQTRRSAISFQSRSATKPQCSRRNTRHNKSTSAFIEPQQERVLLVENYIPKAGSQQEQLQNKTIRANLPPTG